MKQPPFFNVTKQSLPYIDDPTHLFYGLCNNRANTLLLESADINSKQNLKSMLLVDAAVKIECHGKQVYFEALTDNGKQALEAIIPSLEQYSLNQESGSLFKIEFATGNAIQDEDSRLQQDSVFNALRLFQRHYHAQVNEELDLFLGGLFAYDLVDGFEPLEHVAKTNHCPDYVFYLAETLIVIDHQLQQCYVQGVAFSANYQEQLHKQMAHIAKLSAKPHTLPRPQPIPNEITTNINDDEFCRIVEQLKQYVRKGDIFQVVPSRKFSLPCPNSLNAYHVLKQSNPSPYMFYMQDEKFTLFGASPESALKYCSQSNQVEIYPIAGTRQRGKHADGTINYDLDSRIELELRHDKKENAEHMMLVDLARNDVARIAKPGTRHVADLLKVDRYSHVMHLVSRVVGQLRDDLDALHAYQACMNMGTLSGAPKIRAMQLIREVEQERRGSYGGAVGYMTGRGDLDTCIVIRSAYVENDIAYIQAGAGVVYDSNPQAEADETTNKAQAVLNAIINAHTV